MISFDGDLAKNFGEPPGADASVEFHLPEPILCMDVALGKKEVIFVLGINMRHAIAVPDDLNWIMQSLQVQIALLFRKRAAHKHVVCSASQSGQACRRC